MWYAKICKIYKIYKLEYILVMVFKGQNKSLFGFYLQKLFIIFVT